MNNELAIIREDSIRMIVGSAPVAYTENKNSHDRCLEYGTRLLDELRQHECNEELDRKAAQYIEKARKTARLMNERRSPVTKLFDEMRSVFTAMENDVDPSRSGSVPYLVQMVRNQYAAKKRNEELERQRVAMMKQKEEQDRRKFTDDCEADYMQMMRCDLDSAIDGLQYLFSSVTLENYDERFSEISNVCTILMADVQTIPSRVPCPTCIDAREADFIRLQARKRMVEQFRPVFEASVSEEKRRILELMPSKKQELENAAKASAEEAEAIRRRMEARDAEEKARMEAERRERDEKARIEAELKESKAQAESLFQQQASVEAYQPRTSVKKRLVPLNAEAFLEIFQLWWIREGHLMSVEELAKTMKKQLTACEKYAKEGTFIESEHISYEDEVKAK